MMTDTSEKMLQHELDAASLRYEDECQRMQTRYDRHRQRVTDELARQLAEELLDLQRDYVEKVNRVKRRWNNAILHNHELNDE